MVTHTAEIKDNGVFIDNVLIDEDVFSEEKVDWTLREREEQIDSLIDMIGGCGMDIDRQNDKILMKDDLKMLIGWDCKYLFSSVSTNDYVTHEHRGLWNTICEDILEANKEIEK